MVEARASDTREMCRITEPQYSEDTPWHANEREKNEDAPNPSRSSAMLQNHEQKEHRRTNGHECVENDVDGVVLLHAR